MARLDRIYMTPSLTTMSSAWKNTNIGNITDHNLVSVTITNTQGPYIGKGRWTMPPTAYKNEDVLKQIEKLGIELLNKMEQTEYTRTEEKNPQLL
ncbi:hypothetical protein DL96DRAFT_1466775 [Flagelloscypha sp. PMI_526]|nr:hypothetical protein DL96DRAFT_1466775 [Flagelloscypha sp. PMI_526]